MMLLVPAGLAALVSTPQIAERSWPALLLNSGGWIFFLFYATWRIWATLYIGGRKDKELQIEGPYSVCRNPLYCGSLCYALSVASFLKSGVFAATVVVAWVVYYHFVVRAEEHALGLRFGEDFNNYCQRTPRFLPRWSVFHTPPQVRVELKRLWQESIRLARAALLPLALHVAVQLRMEAWWPHWLNLP